MSEIPRPLSADGRKTRYFAGVVASVREGLGPQYDSGHLDVTRDSETSKIIRKVIDQETGKTGVERPWGNVTEHCAVQVARTRVIGRWIGLHDDVIADMEMGAFLTDLNKKQEIEAIKQANSTEGASPKAAARAVHVEGDAHLKKKGFDDKVILLASAAGGDSPQLFKTQEILDKEQLTDYDWAYLLVHLADDYSIGSDWVGPGKRDDDGKIVRNIIDDRAEGNKAKLAYEKIAREIEQDFVGTRFEGMNTFDAMADVSHQIEGRIAQRILEQTGEAVDPLELPELVDKKIEEAIELGELKRIGLEALTSANRRHDELGRDGLQRVEKNQFGETALRADIACEEEVIKTFEKNETPIVVHSEEHGRREIGDNPKYLAVLDGIDGTKVYEEQFGEGRYATLLGIFDGTDPTYDDALFSGIMAHATGELFYAVKGQGAFVRNLKDGTTRKLPRIDPAPADDPKWKKLFASTELDPYLGITMIADMIKKLPDDFDIQGDLWSAVACYLGLLTGERAGLIDGTRKGNLEMAAVYRLLKELGGVVLTLDGQEIGDQKYLTFGQGEEHLPIITASSKKLGLHLSDKISGRT